MFDYLGVFLLLAVVILFGWLTRRVRRAERSAVKWSGTIFAGLLTAVLTFALSAVLAGYWKLNRKFDDPASTAVVEASPERVARGAQLANICEGCHAPSHDSPLTGNDFMAAEGGPPIGRLVAPNLTPAHLASWSDGEILRAVRDGIHRSGRSLLIMPSSFWRRMSDEDLESLVAYLRSIPPAGTDTPPNHLNLLGAAMSLVAPIFEAQSAGSQHVVKPPVGPTAEYGSYVASFTCRACHGEDLLGNPEFESPALIAITMAWTEEQFLHFIRTGVRPDGQSIDNEKMPWDLVSRLLPEDDEVRGVYAYLQEVNAEYSK